MKLDQVAESIRERLAAKYQARERALQVHREVIRSSANAILAVHRGQHQLGSELRAKAGEALAEIKGALDHQLDILYSGFIADAQKEYAEASLFHALILGEELPSPEALGIPDAPYLNGLGEAAGELRRYILDSLRRGDTARGEELMATMDDIYMVLISMDFPDALTGGLKRTTDMVRGVLERTRGDLTLSLRQQELQDRLDRFHTEA